MLVYPVSPRKIISFVGCGTQVCFFFGSSECFLLSMMAYDHFVAICDHVCYSVIMNRSLCLWMAVGSWMSDVPVSVLQTAWMMALPFCDQTLSTTFFEMVPSIETSHSGYNHLWNASTCFHITIYDVSLFPHYRNHPEDALCYWSPEGILHLLTTSHCGIPLTYLWPKSSQYPESKKLVSLSYTVITLMLNPIIYSLRNNEVKGAVRGHSLEKSCRI